MSLLRGLLVVLCMSGWVWTSAFAGDFVLTVDPPSGGDDTAVLQEALDECMADHPTGCTIQLTAGTYQSQQLFGESFHGSLKGMGMDETIIQVLAPLEVTGDPVREDYFETNPPSRTNKYPMLIIFMEGDITVSDMTFEVTEPEPVLPWDYGDELDQTYLYGFLGVIGTSANLRVKRVGFEGGPGTSPTGRNLDNGPFFLGLSGDNPLTGTFKVVSSRVRNGEDSFLVWAVRDAQITIGGSPSDGNVVEPGALGGAFFDLDNSVFEYSHNHVAVYPWYGLLVGNGGYFLPQEPSQFLIQHNTFKATGGYVDGIWPVDFGPLLEGRKTADFVISNNTIQIAGAEGEPAWAGIEALWVDGAIILNNRIVGNATLGIALEGASNCLLKGNNVQKFEADLASIGLLTVDIPTHDCVVVGGNNKKHIYSDDGAYNNTLVGVNNMRGNPPGPAIRDAMKRKMDMIKSMRWP